MTKHRHDLNDDAMTPAGTDLQDVLTLLSEAGLSYDFNIESLFDRLEQKEALR